MITKSETCTSPGEGFQCERRRLPVSLSRLVFALLFWSLFEVRVAAVPPKTAHLLAAGREPVTIVCLGDSITGVYYHSGGLRAYPEMLELTLHKIYPQAQVTVRNAGVSGDTTRGALARLERDVIAHKPNLVTIMLGMNDLSPKRVSLNEFKTNLTEIIKRCRQAGAEVLLCTQNSVTDTTDRPSARLAEFTQVIRDIGRNEDVGVVDCFAVYEAIRSSNSREWALLYSDEIHPNMDGHKVFATAIARSITGKEVSLMDAGPPTPALKHSKALLEAGKPLKVLAMPPFDQLITPALTQLYPGAKVTVTGWPTEGQSLSQIRQAAEKVRAAQADLVLLAVPVSAGSATPEAFHADYSWTMNLSLSFGRQEWDVIALTPSVAKPRLSAEEESHEAFARRLIRAQDLHMITRAQGDESAASELLARWLKTQLQPPSK